MLLLLVLPYQGNEKKYQFFNVDKQLASIKNKFNK